MRPTSSCSGNRDARAPEHTTYPEVTGAAECCSVAPPVGVAQPASETDARTKKPPNAFANRCDVELIGLPPKAMCV